MSTAVSIDTSYFGPPALNLNQWQDNAVSDEAQEVARHADEINETLEQSHALFGSKAEVMSDILALADECRDENWNGEGSSPIDRAAVLVACQFIHALPEGVRLPECAPEPDGAISLDWIRTPTRLVSVSVGAGSRLAYAWLDGTNRGHAVERFDGKRIPERLMRDIELLWE